MKNILVLVSIVFFAFSCASSTEITGAWKNPKATPKIDRILVTALTSKANVRQIVENDLADVLQRGGVNSVKSFDLLPPTFTAGKEPDKEDLLKKVKGLNVDAILTVAFIDKETDNRYVQVIMVTLLRHVFLYYGNFWGYYTNWYPTLYSPGYYVKDRIYFIETNLYDTRAQELLWS
jgi:hypothetical protein